MFQFHIMLTVILLLELVVGVLVFVFYYIPSARHELGFLGPEEALKQAIVRYRDDDDLRDMIDTIQRKVFSIMSIKTYRVDFYVIMFMCIITFLISISKGWLPNLMFIFSFASLIL